MKVLLLGVAVLLLAGCAATLEDFRAMGAYERAVYVCENHRRVNYLEAQVNAAGQDVAALETILARGYRVHTSCKQVAVVKPGTETCYRVGNTITCSHTPVTVYETVCDELPVAIDSALEKEKLNNAKKSLRSYKSLLSDKRKDCKDYVRTLGSERAFDYYQKVR